MSSYASICFSFRPVTCKEWLVIDRCSPVLELARSGCGLASDPPSLACCRPHGAVLLKHLCHDPATVDGLYWFLAIQPLLEIPHCGYNPCGLTPISLLQDPGYPFILWRVLRAIGHLHQRRCDSSQIGWPVAAQWSCSTNSMALSRRRSEMYHWWTLKTIENGYWKNLWIFTSSAAQGGNASFKDRPL